LDQSRKAWERRIKTGEAKFAPGEGYRVLWDGEVFEASSDREALSLAERFASHEVMLGSYCCPNLAILLLVLCFLIFCCFAD